MREKGCLNPNAYINIKDPEHHAKSDYWKEPHDWHATSIKTMLDNPTYLGKIVSGRRTTRSFKDKQIIKQPEENWIVVENTHEAIIDQRTWDLAHEKLQSRKRSDNHGAKLVHGQIGKMLFRRISFFIKPTQTDTSILHCLFPIL